jgi:hypothetical protein
MRTNMSRLKRHPSIAMAALAVLLVAGTAAAALAVGGGSPAEVPTPERLASEGATQTVEDAVRRSLSITEEAPQKKLGEVPSPGALRFPAGVSYAEAVRSIFMAQLVPSSLPAGRLVDPLPDGKVVRETADGAIEVDLGAPYGYHPGVNNVVQTALVHYWHGATEADISAAERGLTRPMKPWPIGASVAVPILPECMIVRVDRPSPDCTEADNPSIDPDRLRSSPLP